MAGAVDDAGGRNVDGFDEACAGELAGAARGEVAGVAGEDELAEAEAVCDGKQQSRGAGGVAVSAVRGVDLEADVTCITEDVLCGVGAEVDLAEVFNGRRVLHAEEAGEDSVDGMGLEGLKDDLEVGIKEMLPVESGGDSHAG